MIGLHLAAFGLVGGAIALHVVSRRAGAARHATTIRLTPSATLHVVELDGRRLLVGAGSGAAPTLLAELAPTEEGRTHGAPLDPGATASPPGSVRRTIAGLIPGLVDSDERRLGRGGGGTRDV